jgi:3-hydroxyisobutyrate dehydrogenase
MPRVAVIGTGTMGAAIATRLIDAGMDIGVWSRHPASTMPLVELGATSYADAADAAMDADIVMTMLPTEEATAQVMFGGLTLRAMRPNAIWVQMATIGVGPTEWLLSEARSRRPDVAFVDAPVSGSRTPAETGGLLILASGSEQVAQDLEHVFGLLGRATLWLGPAGAGSRMKLVLNTWLAFQAEGAAEAASVAERLDVSPPALFAALRDNPLASQYALAKLSRMLDEDYHPDFALDWALKDLDLVESAAGAEAAPVAAAIADRWRGLVRAGSSGLDVSAARKGLGQVAPAGARRRSPDLRLVEDGARSGVPAPAPTAS